MNLTCREIRIKVWIIFSSHWLYFLYRIPVWLGALKIKLTTTHFSLSREQIALLCVIAGVPPQPCTFPLILLRKVFTYFCFFLLISRFATCFCSVWLLVGSASVWCERRQITKLEQRLILLPSINFNVFQNNDII